MKLSKSISVLTLSLTTFSLAQDLELEQQDLDTSADVVESNEPITAEDDEYEPLGDPEITPEPIPQPLSFSLDFEVNAEGEEPASDNDDQRTEEPSEEAEVIQEKPSEEAEAIQEEPMVTEENHANETQPDPEADTKTEVTNQAVVVKVEIKKQISAAKNSKSTYKLLSPWAPKPLQNPPLGWRYVPAHQSQAYPVAVNTLSGAVIDLEVIPYVLVPEDSLKVVQVCEPGYLAEHGYAQKHSISARLETTNQHLKNAVDAIDLSIEKLSALVETLPK